MVIISNFRRDISNKNLAFTGHKTEKSNLFGQKLTCCGHFEVERCQFLEKLSKIMMKLHIFSKYGPSAVLGLNHMVY